RTMRESESKKNSFNTQAPEGIRPCNEKSYFDSYYKATVDDPLSVTDRMTIGPISEMESRFHYNAVENSIIRALAQHSPPPAPAMVQVWQSLRKRDELH